MRELQIKMDQEHTKLALFNKQVKLSTLNSPFSHQTNPMQAVQINLFPIEKFDPLAWIFQVERYFKLIQNPAMHQLTLVLFFMQVLALVWLKWLHANNQLSTREGFTRDLELHFGPTSYVNHQATLFKLQQMGSVSENQQQFEALCNYAVSMNLDFLHNYFISGLHTVIRAKLAIFQPNSLAQAVGLALLVEEKFKDSRSSFSCDSRTSHSPIVHSKPSILGPPPSSMFTTSTLPMKRVNSTDIQKHGSKGLCYNCEDK